MKDPWLHKVCVALGWQGGTIHQVIAEIERLRVSEQTQMDRQAPVGATDPHGRRAFSLYLEECDKHAIEPDTAGAFNWAWQHAPRAASPAVSNQHIDRHLDAVLRASGSALRHYTMQKSLDDMRAAMRDAMTGRAL